jgi:hypothetical protein
MKFWQIIKETKYEDKSTFLIDSSWKSLKDAKNRVEELKKQFQDTFHYYPDIQWKETSVKYYNSTCIRYETMEDITKDFDITVIELHEKLLI